MASQSSKGKPAYLPMSFGEVLGNALKYWKGGLRYYLPLYLVVQLAIAGLAVALIVLSAYNPWITLLSTIFVPTLASLLPASTIFLLGPINLTAVGFISFFVIIIVVSMFLQLLVTGTVIQHSADTHAGLEPGFGQSFRFARRRVISLLGATILSTLITLSFLAAPFAILGIALLGIFLLIWNPFFWIILLAAILALSVASFILLIYVIVRLSVFAPAVVLGGASATASLRQSWKLVHGHFWRVFALILIIGLLVGAIVTVPIMLTIGSLLLWIPPYLFPIYVAVYAVIYASLNACAMPLSPLMQTMLYEDLYARYHGA